MKLKALAVVVVGAGVFAAHSAGAASTAGHAGAGTGSAGGARGHLDCSQLEKLWENAGGSPGEAFMAAEIAQAESTGDEDATDDDGNGTVDRGYWQINSIWGALSTYDPYGNARAAVVISRNGTDWGPWTTYKSDAYAGKC
jgi:lysozyme-like protein